MAETSTPDEKTTARFWSMVRRLGPDDCWEWTRSTNRKRLGYGRFYHNKTKCLAHRFSWEMHNGRIPSSARVLHSCDNSICVNPKHLFLGSQAQNVADMMQKGRDRKVLGQRHHKAKLTERDIPEIRKMKDLGHTTASIARLFSVRHYTIRRILTGEGWKHL